MAEEENQEEEKKGSKKMIIMIVAGLLILGIGAGGAFFFMGGSEEPAEGEMVDGEMAAEPEMKKEMALYHDLHPAFVANFTGKSNKNYMQVYIVAMTYDEAVIEALDMHMPAIRNDVLMTLSATNSQQIETVEGKEELRLEVLARIKETMLAKTGKEGVEDIYFTKFVAQ